MRSERFDTAVALTVLCVLMIVAGLATHFIDGI